MKAINIIPIFKKYAGLWVALKDDQKTVVASGKTAKKAFDKAKSAGLKIPILMKVPLESLPYVGGFVSS